MCSLNKDDFCSKAPVFVGDILWEHLQLLQSECDRDERSALKNAAPKLSETSATQLPLQPPKSYTPFSPPRTYTNLDSTLASPKIYHSPNPTQQQQHASYQDSVFNNNVTSSLPTAAAINGSQRTISADQRYQHPAAIDPLRITPSPLHSRPSPSPPTISSDPLPQIKSEYSPSPYPSPYPQPPAPHHITAAYHPHHPAAAAAAAHLQYSRLYPQYPSPATAYPTYTTTAAGVYFPSPPSAPVVSSAFDSHCIENQSFQVIIYNYFDDFRSNLDGRK